MAEMIPETLAGSVNPTAGERRIFDLLRDCLLPHDDYIVWYEPKSARRLPDFLVWAPQWGLLLIEVKDWSFQTVAKATPDVWTLRLRDGSERRKLNPLEQARRALCRFKDILEAAPPLRQPSGAQKGGLCFPIAHCAIFARISRRQATQPSGNLLRVLDSDLCLFRDDLPSDPHHPSDGATFARKLQRAFIHGFDFPPLSDAALETLRSILFPEVRLPLPRHTPSGPLRTPEQNDSLRALDLAQERVAKQISSDHHVLKGVAGSGKSLVLACRAKFLQTQHPDWQILIVCFNRSLRQYLRQLSAIPETRPAEVFHFHGLVKHLTGAPTAKSETESQHVYDQRIGHLLSTHIEIGAIRQRYHAILIDEAQDLTPAWIQALTQLLHPETNSLLLCLDPAQNIFGRRISYKSMGVNVVGNGRSSKLEKSYRNTVEILRLASRLSPAAADPNGAEPAEDTGERTLFPLSTDRHGQHPILVPDLSHTDQISYILDQVQDLLDEMECTLADIAVLYTDRRWADRFLDAFRQEFGPDKLFWISENTHSKDRLDITSRMLKLSTIESAKGLEFRVVFLVGLDDLPRPTRDIETERKLAYVGLTRAQDLLFLLGQERAGLLKELADIADPSHASIAAPATARS